MKLSGPLRSFSHGQLFSLIFSFLMGHDNKFLNLLYFCVSWPIKEKIKKKGSCVLGRVAAFTPVTKWRYAQHTTYKDFLATHFLDHNTHKKKRDKELICDPRKWWPKSLSFPLSCPTSNQRLLAQSLAGGQDKGKGKGEAERCACEWPFTGFHLSGASRYFLFLIFLVQISSYYFFIIYEIGPGK